MPVLKSPSTPRDVASEDGVSEGLLSVVTPSDESRQIPRPGRSSGGLPLRVSAPGNILHWRDIVLTFGQSLVSMRDSAARSPRARGAGLCPSPALRVDLLRAPPSRRGARACRCRYYRTPGRASPPPTQPPNTPRHRACSTTLRSVPTCAMVPSAGPARKPPCRGDGRCLRRPRPEQPLDADAPARAPRPPGPAGRHRQ